MLEIRKILVAIDFSEWSSRSVNYASLMAQRFGADLDLVHVIMPATLSSPGMPPDHPQPAEPGRVVRGKGSR